MIIVKPNLPKQTEAWPSTAGWPSTNGKLKELMLSVVPLTRDQAAVNDLTIYKVNPETLTQYR